MPTYTLNYNLGKWNLGENPGATALNQNWDIIDSAIWNVSQSILSYSTNAPIQISSNTISLLYRTENLKLSGSYLDTIQHIHTGASPTFSAMNITNDLVVGGKITAEEFHTEFVSSSIIFKSGSTQFGNSNDDLHTFSGSLLLSNNTNTGYLKFQSSGFTSSYYDNNWQIGIGTAGNYQGWLKFFAGDTNYNNWAMALYPDGTGTYRANFKAMISAPKYGSSVLGIGDTAIIQYVSSSTYSGKTLLGVDHPFGDNYVRVFLGNPASYGYNCSDSSSFTIEKYGNDRNGQVLFSVRNDGLTTLTSAGGQAITIKDGQIKNSSNLYLDAGSGGSVFVRPNNSIGALVISSSGATVFGANQFLNVVDTGGGNGYLKWDGVGTIDADNFGFRPKAGGSTYRMFINSTGVGIGINTPNEKLAVAGNISASGNLVLSGQISSSGTANNYLVGKTNFGQAKSGNEVINLYGNFAQSGSYSLYNNFSSGWAGSGWRIDQNISASGSNAEFDNLRVRGTLNVYQLLINQIRATNGTLVVSSVAQVSSSQHILVDPEYDIVTFEDPGKAGTCPYLDDDILIAQTIDLSAPSGSIIKRLVRRVITVSGQQAYLIVDGDLPSDTGSIEPGDVFVRIGNVGNTSRQGVVYLTSDESGAPFIDVINNVASWSDWINKTKLKVRLGNLSGITSDNFGSLTDYGLYAKGGIYLESSASANSIALKVDNTSAQLTMKQQGNTIFDFNTSASIAKIAGWTLTKDKIYSNASSYYWVELNSSGSYPHMYAGYGLAPGVDDVAVYLGRIPNGVVYSGSIGILARDNYNAKTYFVLTDTTKKIANWTFDDAKLYNGTDIVLDATNKKVSVYADRVKMYYTNGSNYGISGSGFQLGSTNNIAGWTFTTTKLEAPSQTPDETLLLTLDADTSNIGLHINTDYEQLYHIGRISVGSTLDSEGNVEYGEYGISYAEDYDYLFRLTNKNRIIAGWSFDKQKLYSGTNVVLDAYNNKISVNSDKVKMYYTNVSNYGISGSGFHLGSTNEIAGWTFTTSVIQSSGSKVVLDSTYKTLQINANGTGTQVKYVNVGQTYIHDGETGYNYTGKYGISATNGNNQILFQLDDSVQKIAGWNFDYQKIYSGTSSLAIAFNTSNTAFITASGKGFELYDVSNPKLFIGDKKGAFLDWNVNVANTLTISGSITGSTILGSRFATGPFEAWAGENGTYAALYNNASTQAPILFMEKYTNASNYCIVNYTPYHTPSSYYLYINEVSASVTLSTIRVGAGTTANTSFIQLDGKHVSKYHGHQSTAPTVNVNPGDTYSSGSANKIFMYANSGWRLLN